MNFRTLVGHCACGKTTKEIRPEITGLFSMKGWLRGDWSIRGKGFARGGGVNSAFPAYSVLTGPLFHVTAELLSLSLGNFAWFWLVSVGARFINERQIWGAGPLQYFSFSPPAEERDQRA
jgi:hypothetical protein